MEEQGSSQPQTLVIFGPQGTLDELKQFHMSPKRVACCHEPEPDRVMGCRQYDVCPFEGKGETGPFYVAVRRVNPEAGTAREVIKSCFAFMQSDYEEMLNPMGQPIEIAGVEGGTYICSWTEMRHKKKDPNCDACTRGTCIQMNEFNEPQQIPAFPRIGTRMVSHVRTQKIRERVVKDRQLRKMDVGLGLGVDLGLGPHRDRKVVRFDEPAPVEAEDLSSFIEAEVEEGAGDPGSAAGVPPRGRDAGAEGHRVESEPFGPLGPRRPGRDKRPA